LTVSKEQTQPGTLPLSSNEELTLSSLSGVASRQLANVRPSSTAPISPPAADRATIGKSLHIKGEVIGSESLYIDGKVEGTINLPDSRVTVSRDAQVSANITAREVVVFGRVCGNITASDHVDLRSEGSLTGDVTAQWITIGDGAFFKGGIDIGKPGRVNDGMVAADISTNDSQPVATSVPA
jgi:cytoskeletal protein CcmA (bactofilin family)